MSLRIVAFSAVDLSLPQGHALHLRGLLDALADRGHDVTLVAPRAERAMPATRFRVEPVGVLRFGVLRHWSFELLGGLRLAARARARHADLIYARQDLYTCVPAIAARMLGIPLVLEVNASIPDEMALWGPPIGCWLARRSERFMLRSARAIVTLGAGLADTLSARTGVARDRFHVVPIATHLPAGIDPAQERTALGVPEDRFVVAFAGNLRPVQGIETLIDALARLAARSGAEGGVGPDAELWIVGTGSLEQSLRQRAAQAGGVEDTARDRGDGAAPRVRFFGGVSRDEADRILACAQILVAPYLSDAYDRIAGGAISTKVLTYLASDRPVLITDLPYYRWIEQMGVGECFPSGDPDALAARIGIWRKRWVEAGRPLRDWPWPSPGPGRRFVEEGRTWDHAAARVEEILRSIVD
jgi:glycosyltransferase involved in cell wall biosynthesis